MAPKEESATAPTRPREFSPPQARESRPRATVLLVDDQPARLLTYEAILAGVGVECVRALSGIEALEKLLAREFAAILLDVEMPGMDGFEVARMIRQHPRMERTPIIFVTGVHISQLDQLKGYEVGAIDYLSVPVVPEILRSKVALLVELHLRRDELKSLNRSLEEARARSESQYSTLLAEREARLRAVFEHPDAFTAVLRAQRDSTGSVTDWIYLDANSNAVTALGLQRESIIGSRLRDIVSIERAERGHVICTEALNTGQPVRYENRFADRDLLITVFSAGQDTVISSGIDITALRRAESAMRANERRDQALLENAPVAIAHNAPDGRFEYVNRAFCDLVGYTAEELRAKTWQELTHRDDVEADRSLGARVLSGELSHYTLEKRYVRKDGSLVWASMFGSFVLDDDARPIQGVAMAMDITERKRVDDALREGRERLLLAQLAARLGIYDWDIEGGGVRWDERTYELWGVKSGEPVTFEVFLDGVHPDDRPSTQAAVTRALDPTGDGRYITSYRVINRADGQTRWIEATGKTRFNNGRANRLVGTVQDVTDRKLAEEKLQLADRRKDEFLAMLAHELRNPVAPINNAAEVLARLLAPNDKARAMVAMIQRQGMNLARLLDDLLDVARITQGRISLRRESISLAACVDLAIETIQPLMDERGHRLIASKSGAPLNVDADKVRIEHCIINLLSNAAKYTAPGGQIAVRVFSEAQQAVIEVTDTGIGISADFLPHVFDLFAQSSRTLDRSQGGLGIGLSICKQLIEMHGGTVSCVSRGPGRGTTFTLRLPIMGAAAEAKLVETRSIDPSRMLIVDDNRDAADSLAIFLQLEGHQTQTAYSATSALRQAIAFQPEIVLLDIGLPDLDGYEVARRLKARGAGIRIIALSGYGQAADRIRSLDAGCETHLTKPVDLDALRALLAGK